MKLYAISDLHLRHTSNRQAVLDLKPHPDDWLILAGDVGETAALHEFAFKHLSDRFARLLWVPGNHDLWTMSSDEHGFKGEEKYRHLVSIGRKYNVLTPEDPYVMWTGEGPRCLLAPLFTLYDYTFRPSHIKSSAEALEWAFADDTVCSDEALLFSEPHEDVVAWCVARCRYTERRLEEAAKLAPLVQINHYPHLEEFAKIYRYPRFKIWCGTQRTADWHIRYPTEVVVYGHLHIRRTHYKDNVRFEEVSFGYPKQWRPENGLEYYLRPIF